MKESVLRLGGKRLAVFVAVCLGLVAPAFGEDLEFAVTWSGLGLGNAATATGIIKIDDTVLLNPGQNDTSSSPFVVDFRMTVSGASAGDGNFGPADFPDILLRTGPGNSGDLPLDFSQELVGQDTGTDPWGTQSSGDGGDFNLFSAVGNAPTAVGEFTLCANGGAGDCMELTSFKPIHTAWLKIKVQTKGMLHMGNTLLGKASAKGTCYWYLQWEGLSPAGGSYYCETTPGDWGGNRWGRCVRPGHQDPACGWQLRDRHCHGESGGPRLLHLELEGRPGWRLQSAKVRTVGGYMAGMLDGVNTYLGDCKISGSKVSESKVPPEAVALTP